MYKENFGENNPSQIRFSNQNEYYQALGFLAKSDGTTSIHWENNENQGALGSEGRIHFYISNPPIPGYFKPTAGTGNVLSRTNCNDFTIGANQNIVSIRSTIPPSNITDFDYGLTL